jgi:hypothetical protein
MSKIETSVLYMWCGYVFFGFSFTSIVTACFILQDDFTSPNSDISLVSHCSSTTYHDSNSTHATTHQITAYHIKRIKCSVSHHPLLIPYEHDIHMASPPSITYNDLNFGTQSSSHISQKRTMLFTSRRW